MVTVFEMLFKNAPRSHDEVSNKIRVPFAYDHRAVDKLKDAGIDDSSFEDAESSMVNVHDLTAIQRFVDKKKMAGISDNKAVRDQPLKVAILDGKKYLYDGHHRATAHVMAGGSMMPAKVVDIGDIAKSLDQPRVPAGSSKGGEFAPKGFSGEGKFKQKNSYELFGGSGPPPGQAKHLHAINTALSAYESGHWSKSKAIQEIENIRVNSPAFTHDAIKNYAHQAIAHLKAQSEPEEGFKTKNSGELFGGGSAPPLGAFSGVHAVNTAVDQYAKGNWDASKAISHIVQYAGSSRYGQVKDYAAGAIQHIAQSSGKKSPANDELYSTLTTGDHGFTKPILNGNAQQMNAWGKKLQAVDHAYQQAVSGKGDPEAIINTAQPNKTAHPKVHAYFNKVKEKVIAAKIAAMKPVDPAGVKVLEVKKPETKESSSSVEFSPKDGSSSEFSGASHHELDSVDAVNSALAKLKTGQWSKDQALNHISNWANYNHPAVAEYTKQVKAAIQGKPETSPSVENHVGLKDYEKTKIAYIDSVIKAHKKYIAGDSVTGLNKQDALNNLQNLTPPASYSQVVKDHHAKAVAWVRGYSSESPESSKIEQPKTPGPESTKPSFHAFGWTESAKNLEAHLKGGNTELAQKMIDNAAKIVASSGAEDAKKFLEWGQSVSGLKPSVSTTEQPKAIPSPSVPKPASAHAATQAQIDKIEVAFKSGSPALIAKVTPGKSAQKQVKDYHAAMLVAHQAGKQGNVLTTTGLKPAVDVKTTEQPSKYDFTNAVHIKLAVQDGALPASVGLQMAYSFEPKTMFDHQAKMNAISVISKLAPPDEVPHPGEAPNNASKVYQQFADSYKIGGYTNAATPYQAVVSKPPKDTDSMATVAYWIATKNYLQSKVREGEKSSFDKYMDMKNEQTSAKSLAEKIAALPPASAGLYVITDDGGATKFEKITGQLGSNEGGVYKDPAGAKYYAKFQKGEDHATNEALASRLYKLAGSDAIEVHKVPSNHGPTTLTKWQDGLENLQQSSPSHKILADEDFGTHAWLGNWDAIGQTFDNQKFDPNTGKMKTVDVGGALFYRAQGEKKPFLINVDELSSLKSQNLNPQASAIFGTGKLTDTQLESMKKIALLDDSEIYAVAAKYAPKGIAGMSSEAVGKRLIDRKNYIAQEWAKATGKNLDELMAEKKQVKVGAPPSLPGVLAEHAANIHKIAQSGDLNKLSVYKVDDLQTHWKTADYASYKAFKDYKKQLETTVQTHLDSVPPPNKELEHHSTLTPRLAAQYPSVSLEAAPFHHQKLYDYALVGTSKAIPSTQELKSDWKNISVTSSSNPSTKNNDTGYQSLSSSSPEAMKLKSALKAAHAKAVSDSEIEKLWSKYKGDGFTSMNKAWRAGDLDSEPGQNARKLMLALAKAGTDLPEGMVLHRGVDMPDNLHFTKFQQNIGSIIQEPALTSTSWGGVAAFSSKNTQLHIHLTKGVKGLPAKGGKAIEVDGEHEIVLLPGTRYLISHVTKKGHQTHVHVLAFPSTQFENIEV